MKIDRIKKELSNYLAYIQLMSSLDPGEGNITGSLVNTGLSDVIDFYKNSNTKELIVKGPNLIKALEPMVNRYRRTAPLKFQLETITNDFNNLCASNRELYSYGIEYQWLDERMDCSKMGLPEDLPWHARIGLGHHSGLVAIEEEFILRDAFYLLESAEDSYRILNEYGDELSKSGHDRNPTDLKNLTLINFDVAVNSRLCVVTFFSFIEVFVNSVGYDFGLRNQNKLNQAQLEILYGMKKGRFLSLESKIEKYPSIISFDKRSPIVISDPAQLREPFKSFVENIKTIRDSSMHYAPIKEAIWKKPLEWLENARSASRLCIDVAREFWHSCYPLRDQPKYLGELNYEKHISIAKERVKVRYEVMNIVQNRHTDSEINA